MINNLFFFILILISVNYSNQYEIEEIKTDFDYLIFRQIWPQSSCMFPNHHTCTIDKNIKTWVVHGLWYLSIINADLLVDSFFYQSFWLKAVDQE